MCNVQAGPKPGHHIFGGGVGAGICRGCACSVVCCYDVILWDWILSCFRIIICRLVDSGDEVFLIENIFCTFSGNFCFLVNFT